MLYLSTNSYNYTVLILLYPATPTLLTPYTHPYLYTYSYTLTSIHIPLYTGLPSRLEHDIRARYLKDVLKGKKDNLSKFKINIEDPPRRKHMVFLGGSVLADIMKDKPEFWITKAEYEEKGLKACLAKIGKS